MILQSGNTDSSAAEFWYRNLGKVGGCALNANKILGRRRRECLSVMHALGSCSMRQYKHLSALCCITVVQHSTTVFTLLACLASYVLETNCSLL